MNYWLIKSEPETYSWYDLLVQGIDHWNDVRNYTSRNNIKEIKADDRLQGMDLLRLIHLSKQPVKKENLTLF